MRQIKYAVLERSGESHYSETNVITVCLPGRMACLPRRCSELTQHKTVVDNHTTILQALKIWRMPNLTIRRGLPDWG